MKKEFLKIDSPFLLESGESLPNLTVCYHHTDNYTPDKRVIWICHALTADSDPEGWWSGMVGDGRVFDTEKYFVVCVNMLGSCYGSTGPASNDANGAPYLLRFPQVTVRDIVKTQHLVKKHLGIETVDVIVGGSIGGFQALEWCAMYPGDVRNMALIACNARVSPWGTAFNESQRMALFADPTFEQQRDIHGGKAGLETARSIALISYRSYDGYGLTQKEDDANTPLFAQKAVGYQRYQGRKLSDRFDAYSYFTLAKAVDSHNIGRDRGGVAKALSAIDTPTVVIGIDSDYLFPLKEQQFLADNIPHAVFEPIHSDYGHDGFLLENQQIEQILKKHISFLN